MDGRSDLKPGSRHIYARRVMHLDEDAQIVNAAENYDGRGQLWRFQEVQSANYYHVPTCGGAAEVVYDCLMVAISRCRCGTRSRR